MTDPNTHDPLRPHHHDPNFEPPTPSSDILLVRPDGSERVLTVADLQRLPVTTIYNYYIVSTGHGTSGPFNFTGTRLSNLLADQLPDLPWSQVEVVSADGFGARVSAAELAHTAAPILLAYAIEGAPMSRRQGLVRLIVPSETDDALRQVKWVAQIRVRDG